MFSYFWNGLPHFLIGLVFVAAYFQVQRKPIPRDPGFWIGVIITSSAIFFLPTHLHFLGRTADNLYQFLHYPVSDWDLLVLGGKYHRFFLTHSVLISLPLTMAGYRTSILSSITLGFTIGLSSHLIWDGVSGSMMTKIVFIPGHVAIAGVAAKAWLVVNGICALALSRVDSRKGNRF